MNLRRSMAVFLIFVIFTCVPHASSNSLKFLKYLEGKISIDELSLDSMRDALAEHRKKMFAPYRQELEAYGCTNEIMLDFCSRVMYAIEHYRQPGFVTKAGNAQMGTHVQKKQVMEYSVTKEGLNVFYDKQGDPKFLLLNTTPEVEKGLVAAFDWFSANGAPDAAESFYNDGLCVIMPLYLEYGAALLYECGVVTPFAYDNTERELKGFNDSGRNFFVSVLWVESFGIAHKQIQTALSMMSGFDTIEVEVVKDYLRTYNAFQLYINYPTITYGVDSNPIGGDAWIEDFARRGVNTDVPFHREIELIMKGNLIDPIGYMSWDNMLEAASLTEIYHVELLWDKYPTILRRNDAGYYFFSARLLFALDNAFIATQSDSGSYGFIPSKYLTRESIIKYQRTGKGLTIIEDPNELSGADIPELKNRPVICLSNLSVNMEKQFRAALKRLVRERPDIWTMFLNKGFVLFMQNQEHSGELPRLRYEKGLLLFDCSADQEKALGSKGLQSSIYTSLNNIAQIDTSPDAVKAFLLLDGKECTGQMLVLDLSSEIRSLQLSVFLFPTEANQKTAWKSSDSDIASVNEFGLVTGHKKGIVTITSTAEDGSKTKVSCKVNVIFLAKEIMIEGENVLTSGKKTTLKAVVLPLETVNQRVSWSTSDKTIASVSDNGIVTAKRVTETKTVVITVEAKDGSGVFTNFILTVSP